MRNRLVESAMASSLGIQKSGGGRERGHDRRGWKGRRRTTQKTSARTLSQSRSAGWCWTAGRRGLLVAGQTQALSREDNCGFQSNDHCYLTPWCWKVVVVEPYKSQTITCISPIRPILVLNRVMLGVHLYGVVAAMKDSWTHPIEAT
jgi:hypothetical protein